MNNVDALFEEHAKNPSGFVKGYLTYVASVLTALDSDSVAAVMATLDECRKVGKRIYFIGNGGSAATASHFANDFGVGMRGVDKQFRAMSLTDNVAAITCVANDEGYDNIFLRQLELKLEAGDIVLAISASGNSTNVVKAVEYANLVGATTIGLLGFDGGKLLGLCKQSVLVATPKGEFGPVEDVHMLLDHLMSSYFSRALRR